MHMAGTSVASFRAAAGMPSRHLLGEVYQLLTSSWKQSAPQAGAEQVQAGQAGRVQTGHQKPKNK